MKQFVIISLFLAPLFGQYCYKDKGLQEMICYEKYFNRSNISNAKSDEVYFIAPNGIIYEIGDKIEIKFNTIGAILSLEKDFELTFIDKLNKETYLFQVNNKNELFAILSNLNQLDSIAKAVPQRERRYSNSQIEKIMEARKARLEKVVQRTQKETNEPKDEKSVGFQSNFDKIGDNKNEGKNFLRGEH